MTSILVLTEEALTAHDVERIATLHGTDQVSVHLLVAPEDRRDLVDALDDVALGRLPGRGRPDGVRGEQAVEQSRDALAARGLAVTAQLSGGDPVAEAAGAATDEIWVVTPPHLVEEALHRDWASKLRERTGRPVLHFVSGTDRVVS
ncbi:hypothetical protein EV189_1255 [Motilibacter rhizosphaerae]|uniref:Universal stress protein family protein n=1 Tax=Motilibacter rhizosphaerae TaxID=598652 RepID=A0A4Q7NRU2_9ACTN|nr:indole-3-glycerol phosphate synthase [Motilibacter rhizosphaerae]RZS89488.1 hypothetical protein EV189_1255 [Motilibacter rhizosphaerae]